MTTLSSNSRRRDGSRTPDRSKTPERTAGKQYPSLKTSLSASFSSENLNERHSPSHSSENIPLISQRTTQASPSLSLSIPHPPPAEATLAALHYLPTPLLVLSSLKNVVLANEAMGRFLGLDALEIDQTITADDHIERNQTPLLDRLIGRSLSQIGVHILQAGRRICVGWEVRTPILESPMGRSKRLYRNFWKI